MKTPIKAARVLVEMTQQQLCDAAEIPLITLRRLEAKATHKGLVSDDVEQNVIKALTAAGVHFIPENGGGWGVRLDKPDSRNAPGPDVIDTQE
jgi:hypothetical protein